MQVGGRAEPAAPPDVGELQEAALAAARSAAHRELGEAGALTTAAGRRAHDEAAGRAGDVGVAQRGDGRPQLQLTPCGGAARSDGSTGH